MTHAQTIVSTQPSNKRAVLEEFGGIYCVYCPHGHEIIAELKTALADRLVLLNYQVGPYAEPFPGDPDLGSDFGEILQDQTQLSGYPAATVNRHVFAGLEQNIPGSTALGRADWVEAVGLILQQNSPVNIAAQATLNITTRQLDIYIEYYYTANAANSNNRLHVGVLQSNLFAPQHGGNAGDYYAHQYLLREFVTGQEGHIINNTSQGTFGSLTYSITLPTDYRNVWVDPVNISLAVFISENGQEIINGVNVDPTLVSSVAADANLLAVLAPADICDTNLAADIVFRNDGNHTLTNCRIRYGITGGDMEELLWTGDLAPLATQTLSLPPIPTLAWLPSNELVVEIDLPNTTADPSTYNNSRRHDFTLAPQAITAELELAIRTDEYGYELYWEIVDDYGVVHASGGNLVVAETNGGAQLATPADAGAYASNSFFIENISLPQEGCYQLRVFDDYADGMCCYYGNGFYRLRVSGESPILQGGAFGAIEEKYFTVSTVITNTTEAPSSQDAMVFPNPVTRGAALQLAWQTAAPSQFSWQLFAASGQLMGTGNQSAMPETNGLPSGYYVFTLSLADQRYNLPLLVLP